MGDSSDSGPSNKLDQALASLTRGWGIFPLVPNTKKPLTPNGFKDASRSSYAARKWWEATPEANVGIATGQASGIVVVDVDVKKGAKGRESIAKLKGITSTLTVRTPSGGFHYYYRCPEGGIAGRNALLPGVDVKADGGYVVGPGSVIDGKPYEWLDPEADIAPLPAAIADLLARRGKRPAAKAPIPEGERNNTLASIAGNLRRRGMERDKIASRLKLINAKRCRPPLPDSDVEAIAASIARYPPQAPTSDDESEPPPFSERALALDFRELYALDWRYVEDWGRWMRWDGARWAPDKTSLALDLAGLICQAASARCSSKRLARKLASAATASAIERLARAMRAHAAETTQWDTNPRLLNTPGHALALQTGEAKAHERGDYMTKMTTATPRGDCPTWRKFLSDVTGGDKELQAYLARVVGYALTGLTTEHVMFFLYGSGANGKSVFLNTLARVWGDYATNAPIDAFLESRGDRHPTDLAKLRGARLVVATEVGQGRRWDEPKIKALTGGDTVSARFMHQDFFDYKPDFKLIIAANHKPSLRNVDEAIRRRLHLIPFTVTIPPEKRDQTLPERLIVEADGILNWAIQGCLEWQRIGLKPPRCVLEATEGYFQAEDALGRWIDDECEVHAAARAATEELYQAWKAWADRCGESFMPQRKFSEELARRGFQRHNDGKRRGFRGIGLRDGQAQEDML